MKTCTECGNENPSSAIHCMKCGNLLVEETALSEEQKLQKKIQDVEKENELLKAALEAKLQKLSNEKTSEETGQEGKNVSSFSSTNDIKERFNESAISETSVDSSGDDSKRKQTEEILSKTIPSNRTLLFLAIGLLAIAGLVGGLLYWNKVYLPAKRDAEAPRYYVISSSLNIRSNTFFDGDANMLGKVSYGTELIVYEDSVPREYFHCKFAPVDAKGKVIKEQVLEGYVHYDYVLPKDDFFLLNSIFGNNDAKEMLSETRYKKALLEVFKQNHFIGDLTYEQADRYGFPYDMIQNAKGRYQVFCRNKKAKNNNVYFSRKYRKDSKYRDVAIILDNLDDVNDRLFLYFVFDDDGTHHLLISCHIQDKGYMKDGTLKLYETYGNYSLSVEFAE